MAYSSYSDIKEEYFKTHSEIKCPVKHHQYRAYKNGSFKVFESRLDAEQYSKLIERFALNVEEYEKHLAEYQKQSEDICELWSKEVREYFKEISDEEYSIIYNHAYNENHAYGYDAVFYGMLDLYEMVHKIKQLHGIK